MSKFKIRYNKESTRIMIVEANDEDEARQKYENFEYIEDYEEYGIDETIEDIEKLE
jgi:hypothetical protein